MLVFASSCSLALDTDGYIRLAITNLFSVILFSFFVGHGFFSYKQLVAHDPWKNPEDAEEGKTNTDDEKFKSIKNFFKFSGKKKSKVENSEQSERNENYTNP